MATDQIIGQLRRRKYVLLTVVLLTLTWYSSMMAQSTAPVTTEQNTPSQRVYLPIIIQQNEVQTTPTTPQSPTTTATPVPPTPVTPTPTFAPSDQALIAAALAAGQIDYGDSLLYRFYALFADERLPVAFQGSGSIGEDLLLFAEASDPTLPADVQVKLRPFLLRPDHPESVHSLAEEQPGQMAGSAGAPTSAQTASDLVCKGKWASQSSAKPGVQARVHTLCTGAYEADLQQALSMIEALWTPMTKHMGQPLADLGHADAGGTTEIDFYLLEPLGIIWREGITHTIRADALAVAVTATAANEPVNSTRSSGYALLARSDLKAPNFKSTLAHEFFHVLQKAHNRAISFHNQTEWWFVEASATWAEWNFVPETSDIAVHTRYSDVYRNTNHSLHQSFAIKTEEELSASAAYAAYIWPFFMQQEQDAKAIADIWRVLETVGSDWEKGMKKIDEQLPFALHFHRFAFRNLNSDFQGDSPLEKRFVDLDPKFPDNWLPPAQLDQELTPLPPQTALSFTDTVPALRPHYYHFKVTDSVQQVRFDFTGLRPFLTRKIGAMVKLRGQPWQMRELLPDEVFFCDDSGEDLQEIWFVVTNHDLDLSKTVSGTILIEASNQSCQCDVETWAKFMNVPAWRGEFTFHYEQRAGQGDESVSIVENADVASTLTRVSEISFMGKELMGTTDIAYVENCGLNCIRSITGSGRPIPYDAVINTGTGYSRINLAFHEIGCKYYFGGSVFVEAVDQDSGFMIAAPGDVMGFRPLPKDSLILSGSARLPVHTFEYALSHLDQDDWFSANHDSELRWLLGEQNLGWATVTWHYEPIDEPPQVANQVADSQNV